MSIRILLFSGVEGFGGGRAPGAISSTGAYLKVSDEAASRAIAAATRKPA